MLNRIDPTTTSAWINLKSHFERIKDVSMIDMFRNEPDRFSRYSLRFEDMLVDYSKNIISDETMSLLLSLADECDVKGAIDQMFAGERINETENRSVLHVALRNRSNVPIMVDDKDVMPEVNAVLGKMEGFSAKIITGTWKGYTGKPVSDIVNIGIGGSDLGPVMATEALKHYGKPHLHIHFISNIDGTHITETLRGLSPETTLFMVRKR